MDFWGSFSELMSELGTELLTVVLAVVYALPYLAGYIALIILTMFLWRSVKRFLTPKRDFGSLKTVTFGDESTVTSNFVASIVSIVFLFLLWGSFTGSILIPSFLHAPGPFSGQGSFNYTVEGPDGTRDDAVMTVLVHPTGEDADAPEVDPGDGFALNDAIAMPVYRSEIFRFDENDAFSRDEGAFVALIEGQPVEPSGEAVDVGWGEVSLSRRGSLNITPNVGWQMEPIWLPSPEAVYNRLIDISWDGFQNSNLAEHVGFSLFRVIIGFLLGAIFGIPLGYAMGLSDWFRGWFDPIVEFMRPVPPLALIPLVIIWAGIGEVGKIILLFLAALWIMAIAARAGVSGVRITKVHAAYSLGASRWQIMRHVIIPNSLPEIFTGARVAMGVCWGTVVAAELVAAEKGAGMMIMVASRFQNTDIVIMGIILIGVIGFAIDMAMRMMERWLVPWKGKA